MQQMPTFFPWNVEMKTIPLQVFDVTEEMPHIDENSPYSESSTCMFFTVYNSVIIGRLRENVLGVKEIWTGCSSMPIQTKYIHSWAYIDDVLLEVGK